MKHYKMRNMRQGYFVGNFEPTAFSSGNVEIAFRHLAKGALDGGYYRKNDRMLIYILSGKIDVDGTVYKKNDILSWESGEVINLFGLESAKYILIKFPGTAHDMISHKYGSFDEMDAYYQRYISLQKRFSYEPFPKDYGSDINSADVSVVVQGYTDRTQTAYSLASIRKYLPDATIILSTWKECDYKGLDYDELVLNEDPGCCECSRWPEMKIANNGNRQIVSTKGGLDRVKTKYALKMRSDMVLLGDNILKCFGLSTGRKPEYKLFSERILIGELFTRNKFAIGHDGSVHTVPKPFHPSDWFMFGRTEDIREIYEHVELIPQDEMANYPCKYPKRVTGTNYKYSWRYTTEQHILLGIVRQKYPELKFEDWTDWNRDNIEFSRNIMLTNFTILNFMQHQLLNLKYVASQFCNSGICYREKYLMNNQQLMQYIEEAAK